ncbi:Zinc finger homeobox protein 3 [Allomyces arbusculus]|nr:Zinc finger homeobox protein 3 [Allomyces arbusculus]
MLAQPAPVPLVAGKKFRRATAEELSAVTQILAQERSKTAPPPTYQTGLNLHLHHHHHHHQHLASNTLADRAPHLPAPTAMPASPAASPLHWRPILPAPAPAPTQHSPLLLAPTPPASTEDASMMMLAAGPATTASSTPPPPPPRRRNRTIMSAFQTCVLRRVLALTAFPSTQVREMLAAELGMPPRTVQIWFQNQRQKAKARAKLAPTGPTAAGTVDAVVGSALDAGSQVSGATDGGGAVAAPVAPALIVPVAPAAPALAPATHPFGTPFSQAHLYAPHGPFMIAPTLPAAAFIPPTPAPAPPPTPSTAMAGLSVRSVPPTPTSANMSMPSHDAVLQAHHVQFLLHHAHASSTSTSMSSSSSSSSSSWSSSSSPTSADPAALSGNMPSFTYAFDAHARTPAPAPILMPTPPESTSPSLAGSLAIAPAAEGDAFSTSLGSSLRVSPTTGVVDDVTLPPIAPLSAATHHAPAPLLPRVTLDAGDSPSNAVLHGPRRQRKPRPAPIAVVPTTLAALAGTTPGRRIAHGRLRGPPATAPVVPSAAAQWPAPATPIEMPMSACRAPEVSPLDLLAAAAAVLEPVPSPMSPNA